MKNESVAIIGELSGKGAYFVKGIYEYLSKKAERDFEVELIDIETKEFEDGEFKVRIKENVRGKYCFLIYDPNQPAAVWFTKLAFLTEALRFSNSKERFIIFPYMRFTRQERKEESRVGVSAKAVADLVSLYSTRGMTVDLHAPQIQEYFNIPFDNLYSFPSLINYLKIKHPELLNNLVIGSPDTGGTGRAEAVRKRLKKAGIETSLVIGYKKRDRQGNVEGLELNGDVQDCNVLFIDDIISTGSTVIQAAEAARKKGAKIVAAYGTHGLLTQGTEKLKQAFDIVMVSDSLVPSNNNGIEIVSLIPLFGEAIYRNVTNQSLSALFE